VVGRPQVPSRGGNGLQLKDLSQDPDWTPTNGSNDDFGMADLLSVAGVVATIA
jgi:hypothetical protein